MMYSPPRLFSAAGLGSLEGASPSVASDLGYPGLSSPGNAGGFRRRYNILVLYRDVCTP
jgi:hypothetical protein